MHRLVAVQLRTSAYARHFLQEAERELNLFASRKLLVHRVEDRL
jgi:hypothetical protein